MAVVTIPVPTHWVATTVPVFKVTYPVSLTAIFAWVSFIIVAAIVSHSYTRIDNECESYTFY